MTTTARPTAGSESDGGGEGGSVKVGVLHSLIGTMSITRWRVRMPSCWPSEEINADGGVLGKQIEPVEEDARSDWPTFAEKAEKSC
jgi:urea transport system substrate-binding protein